MLVVAAALMSWLPQPTLARRFDAAWEALTALFPGKRRAGYTYQGYVKALLRDSPRLLDAVEDRLRQRMRDLLGPRWTMFGYEVFTVDGSRLAVPRTADNQKHFRTGAKQHATPQAALTTLLHMGSGVTWDYRVGPGDDDERGHLRDMAHRLPPGALLVGDAGFTGYGLLRQLITEGRHLLIRAGANVRLLRKLGFATKETRDTVYLWPGDAQRQGEPPLILRLIRVRADRRRSKRKGRKRKASYICLLTDLPASKLSDHQAQVLYRRRWGIECFYRGLKQTMNKTKMLSKSPALAELELRWTMIGLWLLRLFNAAALIERRRDPLRGSVAQALSVMEKHLRHLRESPHRSRWRLWRQLGDARQDSYTRRAGKQSRDYPRQKKSDPPREPKLRCANSRQRDRAQWIASQFA